MAQHVQRDERGLRTEEADALFARMRCFDPERLQHALIREHGIQACELFHRHLATAERQRKAVEGFGFHVTYAGGLEELIQGRLPQLRGH